MMPYKRVLLAVGVVGVLGLQPIVFGQNQNPNPNPNQSQAQGPNQRPGQAASSVPTERDPVMQLDQRLRQLELDLSMLTSQVRSRTDVVGPEDRTTRDMNLDSRLDAIERELQQVNFTVSDLQRQISDAQRAVSQAQNDAMLAQQLARDAQARIN